FSRPSVITTTTWFSSGMPASLHDLMSLSHLAIRRPTASSSGVVALGIYESRSRSVTSWIGMPSDEHLKRVLGVELHQRRPRLSFLSPLLGQEAVEPADRVVSDGTHRPRPVQQNRNVYRLHVRPLLCSAKHVSPNECARPTSEVTRHASPAAGD